MARKQTGSGVSIRLGRFDGLAGPAIVLGVAGVFEADTGAPMTPRERLTAQAVAWLEDRFRECREWSSAELKRRVVQDGISYSHLFKSSEVAALPIEKRKRQASDGTVFWTWAARDGWPTGR